MCVLYTDQVGHLKQADLFSWVSWQNLGKVNKIVDKRQKMSDKLKHAWLHKKQELSSTEIRKVSDFFLGSQYFLGCQIIRLLRNILRSRSSFFYLLVFRRKILCDATGKPVSEKF